MKTVLILGAAMAAAWLLQTDPTLAQENPHDQPPQDGQLTQRGQQERSSGSGQRGQYNREPGQYQGQSGPIGDQQSQQGGYPGRRVHDYRSGKQEGYIDRGAHREVHHRQACTWRHHHRVCRWS